MMEDVLKERIHERRARLTSIENQIKELSNTAKIIEGEIKAYEDTLSLLGIKRLPNRESPSSFSIGETSRMIREEIRPKDISRISNIWRYILSQIAENPAVSLDDVRAIALTVNPGISDETIRSQLSEFVARGWLDRPKPSLYSVRPEWAKVLRDTTDLKSSSPLFSRSSKIPPPT
jgi:hypothetical protein